MKRPTVLAALALLPALAGGQEKPQPGPTPSPTPQATEPPGPTFPAQVELVTVDAVVTEKKTGQPVKGLTRDNFVVTEDGKPQSIVSFEAVTVPEKPSTTPPPRPTVSTNVEPSREANRTFVILFDDIHLSPFHAHRAKTAVSAFLKNGVREGDRVTLISAGGDAWWNTRMEAGRDELLALLKRLDGRYIPDRSPERMSDWEAMRIHVYSDPQVTERVNRRFVSYGATPGDTPRGGMADPMGDGLVRGRAADVYFQAMTRNRLTLEVMERILNSLTQTKGRKSLILVSEGFIFDPNLEEFKDVVQASRRGNCAIYFLDTRGLEGLPAYFGAEFGPPLDTQDLGAVFVENLQAAEGSESLAVDSGGFIIKNTNDLSKGIQRIADENRSYYLIGYQPTNTTADGRFRKIKLEVNRKGVELRARKGYFAPLEGGKVAEKKKPGVDPEFQAALDSPYEVDDIPLRMSAYVFEEALLGKARTVVAFDTDIRKFAFEEKEGRFFDTLEFLLVVAHRESGEFFRYDQKLDMKLLPETRERMLKSWLPQARDFELAPGGYQAKVVVRDKNSGRVGSVIHEFEVPDQSQFRTSSLVLTDVLQPAESEKAVPRALPVARRSFAPGATLFCQFEVFGAEKDKQTGMPRVSAGYVVRGADGGVVTQVAPTTINPTSIGKVTRLVGTKLEDVAPGTYEFVLSLKDEVSGKTLEIREPFTLGGTG
jgi:VWFA-related protein